MDWRSKLDVATLIARSWETEPKRWKWTEHRATRDDGLEVWIGNGMGGLEIEYQDQKIGSTILFPIAPWRWVLGCRMRYLARMKRYEAFAGLFKRPA